MSISAEIITPVKECTGLIFGFTFGRGNEACSFNRQWVGYASGLGSGVAPREGTMALGAQVSLGGIFSVAMRNTPYLTWEGPRATPLKSTKITQIRGF